jgi:hypothetical protein
VDVEGRSVDSTGAESSFAGLSVSRKLENDGDERSMRVKSDSLVFSSNNARFCILRSLASFVLAATSASSWPMYS